MAVGQKLKKAPVCSALPLECPWSYMSRASTTMPRRDISMAGASCISALLR